MLKKTKKLTSLQLAKFAAQLAADKQAVDIIVLDLRKVTDFADFFVICTGVVDVHVRAIYDSIESELTKLRIKPKHIEGENSLRWVLMDYIDIVVSVFQPDARGYYALERLWGDAKQVKLKINEQ